MKRVTPEVLLTGEELKKWPAEAALLSIAIQRPDRVGEVLDAIDLDLWGEPRLRSVLELLASMVHHAGADAVDYRGLSMEVYNQGLHVSMTTMSDLLDVAAPSQSVRPFADAIRRQSRDRQVRDAINALDIAADDGDDIAPYVRQLQEAGTIGQSDVRPMLEVMSETIDHLQTGWTGEGAPRWTTGFASLDDRLDGGIRSPQLIVIGGRPGMGKTAFGLQIADAVATAGGRVHVYSGEMGRLEIGGRLLSLWSDVDSSQVSQPRTMPQATMDQIVDDYGHVKTRGYSMTVDDRGGKTWSQVVAGVMKSAFRHGGLDLVLVDYLQLLQVPKGGTEYSAYTEASKAAKALAKELRCVVILLAQLSRKAAERKPDDRKPKMTDLRATGQIEQDADLILFPYRPVLDDPKAGASTAEIGCAKYRQGASGWWEPVQWNGPLTRFEEIGGVW